MEFGLNPALNLQKLSRQYADKGRLQVRDVITQESAEEIHRRLSEVDWWLVYNEGKTVHQLRPQDLRNLTREQAMQIQVKVNENAAKGYQYLYNYFPLLTAYFSPKVPSMPLFPVYEFINSKPFLEFARKLTGLNNILWADGQATLYRATHFLKVHTDQVIAEKRLAAYVFNFTPQWDTDWGGLLQFWTKDGDIEQAYRPAFNALNVFSIPARHSVSMVTPYCPGLRFSITGWFRGDDPPGVFGLR